MSSFICVHLLYRNIDFPMFLAIMFTYSIFQIVTLPQLSDVFPLRYFPGKHIFIVLSNLK